MHLNQGAGTMILVQLPADILDGAESMTSHQITYDHAELIQNKLFHDYQIEASTHKLQPQWSFRTQVPVKALDGKLYVRISAHIYNELDQYSKLASAVNDLRNKTHISL